MEATIKTTNSTDKLILIVVIVLTLFYYIALSNTYFHAISKIEEGTIVQRNDSIKTVIIPDRR